MAGTNSAQKMHFVPVSPLFDPAAFDEAIATQSVPLLHYRCLPCPVGLADPDGSRYEHSHHANCSNGFLYRLAGEVDCVFQANNTQNKQVEMGQVWGSSARITPARWYTDTREDVVLSPYDRLYLKDVQAYAVNWELFESHLTGNDRLQYPIKKVEVLIDSDGVEYSQNTHFVINQWGQIEWLGEKRPGMDANGRGKVCSCRYRFTPFWYVKYLDHEIRVCRGVNEQTGDLTTERMPYSAVLQREITFEAENRDENAPNPNSLRQASTPSYGSFQPR